MTSWKDGILFNLTNVTKLDSCFATITSTTTDLFLTNRPDPFQKSGNSKISIGDFHKLVNTFLNLLNQPIKMVNIFR